ncbi:MAG TPA: phosphoenolpyruvate synthase, partial [Thermoplasmatales archaeon]|nr:phosphoenolpyruvate synthase [Thermoplasmatales archaeon]
VTYGIVNNQNICEKNDFTNVSKQEKHILKGISCCPSIVKGKAKVILSPKNNVELNGEIIVAERTDPGWVPLYPSASGLLIERGSVLSHSAIVARELGLPTIVGIKNLTKLVKDGQIIKMDAGKGIVYLHPDKKTKKKE